MNRLVQFFSSGNSEFFDMFDEAGSNALLGSSLLVELLKSSEDERKELSQKIKKCENEGDSITKKINTRLNKTFVTPFEREDIYELASTLDDILDFIERAADYVILYRIKHVRPEAIKQAELVHLSMEEINKALPKLDGFKDITKHIDGVKELEHKGDKLVRENISNLFHKEENMKKLIAWKDMFEVLEDTLDATERHINVLKGITIQNS